eukprot:42030-Hanusia_phi.AAC.4
MPRHLAPTEFEPLTCSSESGSCSPCSRKQLPCMSFRSSVPPLSLRTWPTRLPAMPLASPTRFSNATTRSSHTPATTTGRTMLPTSSPLKPSFPTMRYTGMRGGCIPDQGGGGGGGGWISSNEA